MRTTKNQLLQKYTLQLATHPLRTKAATAGILSFLQEVIASHVAGAPVKRVKSAGPLANGLATAKIDARAVKMAVYGFFISAPLGHVLVGRLQRAFAGKTSAGAKLAQIILSNLLIAPIQTAVYLASMAVIGGARSVNEVKATIRAGFMTVLRVTWVISPISTLFAQRYVPQELWVPFFNLVTFVLGTYFNAKVKISKLRAEKAKKDREAPGA